MKRWNVQYVKKTVKNIQLHFSRNIECGENIDLSHFVPIYQNYKNEIDKNRILNKTQNYQKKQKEINHDAFKAKQNVATKRKQKEMKTIDPETFKLKKTEANKKYLEKMNNIDSKLLKTKLNEANKKYQKKQKDVDPNALKAK